jgi:hypothetical protein
MRLIVRNPSQQVSIKGLTFSDKLKELRIWVQPDSSGGADIYLEGDCEDEQVAPQIADDLTAILKQYNDLGVQILLMRVTVSTMTKGLFDNARLSADGKRVSLHIHATPEQLDAVLRLAETQVGATPGGRGP